MLGGYAWPMFASFTGLDRRRLLKRRATKNTSASVSGRQPIGLRRLLDHLGFLSVPSQEFRIRDERTRRHDARHEEPAS